MRIQRPNAPPVVQLRVYGEPKPAGSKGSGVSYRKDESGKRVPVTRNGKIVTFVKDTSGKPGKEWRNAVADVAVRAQDGEPLLDGPLYVEMTFFMERPKGHFRTGRFAGLLKDSAPPYPAVIPDVLKLARAVEDSLSGTLWRDDSRLVRGDNEKVYAEDGEPIGVEVRVWRLPATVGELAEPTEARVGAAAWEPLALDL